MVQDVSKALGPLVLVGSLLWLGACGAAEETTPETAAEGGGEVVAKTDPDDPSLVPAPDGPPLDGFQQLMKRGGIAALFDPQFVAAAEAEIPDGAWVMGFELAGQAYAYDLNTLNSHEVVNHEIGNLPVAAVW